jgi:hypothetical protein
MITSRSQELQSGAGWHIDASDISQLTAGFIGSAVVKTTGGSIVAGVMEMDSTNYYNKAYEGVGVGSSTVYMPSALCNFNASGKIQNSYYAIQNTSDTTATNITVNWSNGNTTTVNNVQPFTKAVVAGCSGGNTSGFLGSATITSKDASDNPIPVIGLGKVSGGGLSTAFVGFSSGVKKVALPYIRWAKNTKWVTGTMQRANLAIQNVGSAPITGVITVKYINPDGTLAGSHPIDTTTLPGGNLAVGGKVNSNPPAAGLTEFGCQNNCTTYGGGAIVEGPTGSELAVIARLTSYVPLTGARVGEDTNGVPHPTP